MRRKTLSTSIRNGRTRLHLDPRQQLAQRIMTKLQADVLLEPPLLIEEAVTLSGLSTALCKGAQTQLYQINGLFRDAQSIFCWGVSLLGRIHRRRSRRSRRGGGSRRRKKSRSRKRRKNRRAKKSRRRKRKRRREIRKRKVYVCV